jgi:hypothetical protein
MPDLKLIALDTEDLAVLSTNLQDAVVRTGDMTFLKRPMRFAALANRFDWEEAAKKPGATFKRRRCGLRFERVLDAKVSGLDLTGKDTVLSLLSIVFEPENEPHGFITLRFSGGGAIRLEVECIEAELKDLGAAWTTRRKPEHTGSDQN